MSALVHVGLSLNGTGMSMQLPQLLQAIRMIHTVSRHYNTSERLASLFVKITNQMITTCKTYIKRGTIASLIIAILRLYWEIYFGNGMVRTLFSCLWFSSFAFALFSIAQKLRVTDRPTI